MRVLLAWALVTALGGCGSSRPDAAVDAAARPDAPPARSDAGPPGDGGADAGRGDGGVAALRGHRGNATLSGAVQAASPRYRVIMSTGQSPGGNGTAASPTAKLRGGVVGATQGR